MGNLIFAPGEESVAQESFSPSTVLFWLKTEIAVTNTRLVGRRPNTLLGLIPLGSSEETHPLANIAGTATNVKVFIGRGLLALIVVLVGLGTLGDSPLGGFIMTLLGIALAANSVTSSLSIRNNAGGETLIRVSIFEKQKLEVFKEKINQQLFADHARLRHQETMGMHTQNLLQQQAQLNLQQQMVDGISTLKQPGSSIDPQ